MSNPAVETAKMIGDRTVREEEYITSHGVRVLLKPVSATLIDEVVSFIKEPDVPMWFNPDKEREEPNYSDPNYLKEMSRLDARRGSAAMDAMIMFGVDLIDGLPEDNGWIKKLQLMHRRGLLDLSEYNFDDPVDLEFIFKRYVIADANIIERIGKLSGMGEEEVARAEKSFQGDEVQ